MQVHVLLFGALKEKLARDRELMELPENTTVEQLLHRYVVNTPQLEQFVASLAVAVNREYARPEQMLHEGDEVALLPPVSGGCLNSVSESFVRLQREPIQGDVLLTKIKDGADGALVVFDGIVRNQTRGRRTLYLDYEAYDAMALEQMRALVGAAKLRFEVREVVLVHRLDRLGIGETSVWIAVAAAHRAAAFDACRWIIDTLKKTVPIWKKEYFEDGAIWADGEPFPAEVAIRTATD